MQNMAAAAPMILMSSSLDAGVASRLKDFLKSSGLRIRQVNNIGDADLVLPVVGLAMVVIRECDLLFSLTREKTLVRLVSVKKKYRNCFSMVLVTFGQEAFAHHALEKIVLASMKQQTTLPTLVFNASVEQIARTLQTFSKAITKEKKQKIDELVTTMHHHLVMPDKALVILRTTIAGVESDHDCELLQDLAGSIATASRLTARLMASASPISLQSAIAVESFFAEDH